MNKISTFLVSIVALTQLFSCSPASPKLKPLPIVINEKVENKNNEVFRRPTVDILFVVDDSGSMSTHQTNLSNNVDTFVNEFSKLKLIDYHIGVLSSSMESYYSAQNGKLQDPSGLLGNSPYVTANTPNGLGILRRNIKLGTNGSATEAFFDPVYFALSPPLINTFNKGFYREDAYLIIIFITDAEEQSTYSNPRSFMDFLLTLKKNNKNKILSYGAIIPSGYPGSNGWNSTCPRDQSTEPKKMESFLSMTVNAGKNIVALCDSNFGAKLVEFSKEIVNTVNKPIILKQVPVVSTIKVKFGTQIIPSDYDKGWYYDPVQNAIMFGENLYLDESQPDDAKLDVSFDAVQLPGAKNK